MSTSPVSYCWTMAGTSPSAERLSRAATWGSRDMRSIVGPLYARPPPGPSRHGAIFRHIRPIPYMPELSMNRSQLGMGGGDPGRVQIGVHAGLAGERGVRAALDQAARVEDEDLVGVLRGGEAVGDGDGRAAPGAAFEGARQAYLRGRVDRRGGLVQQQQ